MWLFRALAPLLVTATFGAELPERELAQFFTGREGCFVLYDSKQASYLRYNAEGCARRFSPCSTFKIPHTLLALHSGVASGPEFSIRWDGVKRGYAEWDRDQTLQSAFQNSTVWFYQELARRFGPERETDFLRKINYGNADTSGGLTNFWLESSLLISADEQVEFLRRLWTDTLPVSREAQRTARQIMELARTDGRILYGKTGTGGSREGNVARLGWFVGCVTRGDRTLFFATRITAESGATGREARRITESILTKLNL